jgi:type I restriction-modification system DNA methylase subunit
MILEIILGFIFYKYLSTKMDLYANTILNQVWPNKS